jgi:hypothetical protein
MQPKAYKLGAWPVLASLAAGCSSDLTPELPSAASIPALHALTGSPVVGTPTELYTRLAHGAVTCWFGATGPLKGRYIYHADALPESKGGGSQITIFAKDTSMSPDPRALKAYQIAIRPTGGSPELGIENFKMPEPLAKQLDADVRRWAAAEEGCGTGPITEGWHAQTGHKPAGKAKAAKRAGP